MKRTTRVIIIIILASVLAMALTAFTQSLASRATFTQADAEASFFFQATTTPEPKDQSEVGSTDGIIVMGGVISLIIIIPILARRKRWANQPSQ
ncbi:MAG: hypothetical protein CNIPEHKO_00690 [Anaerolineales bacterium]|nr:hypothetical protein [Anaerolineae bacterium]MBV6400405.1 hypothetical protein [Anaerolineales bacterium]MCC7189711.1 hypothetical protein [Anaerolineales bacterium]